LVATKERQITNLSHFSNTRTIQIFRQTMSTRQLINTLLILMLPIYLIGQRQNDIWLFGLGAGLDFSSGSPVKIENAKMFSKEGCAVISDDNGQLLFYTNGIKVWNAHHQVMPNGNDLKGGAETSSTNQAIIVPYPSRPNLYYIFTTDERAGANGLNYSLVDINLDNGLGDIIAKNILLYTPTTERLALARHSDGEGFWLVTHGWQSNEFIIYSIDKDGLNDQPIISKKGTEHHPQNTSNLNARGYIAFNSDFTKMAIAVYKTDLVELFDFNTCTGKVNNAITTDRIKLPYGLAFSPNDKLLYVTNLDGELYQLDATATNSSALNNSVGLVGSTVEENLSAIQQGPDGKLYIAIPNAKQLGVINQPNNQGLTCDYQDIAIDLGTGISAEGLPQRLPFMQLNGQNPTQYQNASIVANDGCENEQVSFSIQTNEEVEQIIWSFNDETTVYSLTTAQIFKDTGIINVSAILSNQCKLDTVFKTIHIRDCSFPLFIPNAFSPNDDGDNDTFLVQGKLEEIQTFEMIVFSRWGDTVFRSTNPFETWNGKFKDKQASEGVYIWMAKVKFHGIVEEFILSGDLTLFR
jgi:gliding motility-associated-like protein